MRLGPWFPLKRSPLLEAPKNPANARNPATLLPTITEVDRRVLEDDFPFGEAQQIHVHDCWKEGTELPPPPGAAW